MKQTILLFAAARERVGASSVTVDLPPHATVADVRAALRTGWPVLAEVLGVCQIAVNMDFAADASALPADAEVAVIPPVSGG